ncbi:hypothetical protein SCAR479_04802 [Seiridium cardinale]|uniref:Protein-S-isoprenylcysteine O-methyltransferase n=1 Tax=Seiridium cardinale TaxID=138064 RepID=A0ABR2XXJ3_9PEZI
MEFHTSLPQALLAAAMIVSTVGSYIACSPPHPNPETAPPTSDFISSLNLTRKHATKITMAPLGLLLAHTCLLVFFYPDIPPAVLNHGAENGLNADLITWSAATAIPLALILFAGIPLRLISYSSLGKNFTFALAKPDRLTTTGIHRYMQHPSYTGVVILIVCNVVLFGRADGVMSCWIAPAWLRIFRTAEPTSMTVIVSMLLLGVWTRVKEEERMLQAEFGVEWERWHSKTPRFIPWLV